MPQSSAGRSACARRTAASGSPIPGAQCHGARARLRAGAGGGGLQARRQAVRARRQPRPPLLGAAGRAGAGRHVRAALSGLDRQRAGLRARPRRGVGGRGRGPGAGRQGPVHRRRAAEPAPRRLRGSARHERLRASDPQILRRAGGDGRAPSPRSIPTTSSARWTRARAADVAADRLYVGHHRQVEGRAAEPRQHDRHLGELRQRSSRCGAATTGCATCRWAGSATSIFSLGTSMVVGATCNCPESPETVQRDLRELGPSALLAPPRIWENMLTGLQVKAADASWLKRRVFEYFRAACRAARAAEERRQADPGDDQARLPAGRGLRLRPGARPARPAQCALRA